LDQKNFFLNVNKNLLYYEMHPLHPKTVLKWNFCAAGI